MPAIFEHFHTVTDGEIDQLGHANNLEYLRWMLTAAVAHSTAQGWPAEAYERLGAGFVVRSHQIKYLQSAYAGDDLAVVTWVAEFKRMSSLRRYKVLRRRDAALLASAATEWAFVDMQTRALRRIPPELAAAFEIVADADA